MTGMIPPQNGPKEALSRGLPQVGALPEGYDGIAVAKLLLRSIRSGALATIDRNTAFPVATLVSVATDYDGAPILLMSQLSAHTRNLDADARASILLAQGGKGDPLAHPRITVTGEVEKAEEPALRSRLRTRFLARNPKASLYADFGDFSFWRLAPSVVHLNGGFAKAADFAGNAILTDLGGADGLLAAEADALAHLNEDHAGALSLYAVKLAGQQPGHWRATGLDPEGLDLSAGDQTARLAFPSRISGPDDLRRLLVDLANAAREKA